MRIYSIKDVIEAFFLFMWKNPDFLKRIDSIFVQIVRTTTFLFTNTAICWAQIPIQHHNNTKHNIFQNREIFMNFSTEKSIYAKSRHRSIQKSHSFSLCVIVSANKNIMKLYCFHNFIDRHDSNFRVQTIFAYNLAMLKTSECFSVQLKNRVFVVGTKKKQTK